MVSQLGPRHTRLFHRGRREEGEEGWAERVFRISFPGIGGETASPSSRETANNYASVRRCGADARARDQRRPGQCACGLIATLPYQRVNSHCRETFIHASVVERVRGDGRRPCSLRKWLPRGRKQQVKNRRNVCPTSLSTFFNRIRINYAARQPSFFSAKRRQTLKLFILLLLITFESITNLLSLLPLRPKIVNSVSTK